MSDKGVTAENPSSVVKQTKKKNKARVHFWAVECKYSVILDTVASIDWKLVEDERLESKVNLFWIDVAAIHERFRTIQPWQMINHFPGMPNIARKNRMGQNLNRMQRLFPKEYSFYPRTWILPGELNEFRNQFDSSGNSLNNKIFIIKPDAGCQGRGIFLTRTIESVPINENVVAQVYIKKPMLLDNYKFDLRIYVYVACVKPLRMYLFHDGLVRMCTEEYVKPTKSNLNMMCMHLTNYAVNKHNNNFAQPAGIDDQDHSSKRSLQWFMMHVANTHGTAKADWMWKRIGVLCTRTVLSILPTLSREYDAHFRTFNNIPVDASQIPGFTAANTASTSKLPVAPGSSKRPTAPPSIRSTKTKESGSDEEGVGSSSAATGEEEEGDQPADAKDGNGEDADKKPIDPLAPKMRGSRSFEILGFDIMIESNLNPILIEVNHLPSFGTDSALDLDVKERLMQQVFSVLPTMADDYPAYVAHMKAEAEKRQAEKAAQLEANRANNKIWRGSGGGGGMGEKGKDKDSQGNPRRREQSVERRSNSVPREVKENQGSSSGASNATDAPSGSVTNSAANNTTNNASNGDSATAAAPMLDIVDEDCTPERLEEIKAILTQVYTIYSPEKISKIDRLLHKYLGHEEEFLRFVYAKYNVNPALYEKRYQPQITAASSSDGNNEEDGQQGEGEQEESNEDGGGEGEVDGADGGGEENENEDGENKDDANSVHTDSQATGHAGRSMEMNKRISRSLSPPRNKKMNGNNNNQKDGSVPPNRRMSAAWKAAPDDDAAFRQEVLKEHVPTEDEEWMKYEMSKLTQFTRIFPPLPKSQQISYVTAVQQSGTMGIDHSEPLSSPTKAVESTEAENAEEEGEEEKEEEEDEEGAGGAGAGDDNGANAVAAAAKKKIASYEDIICQVFLQDRRQTMRLRCPLPNRAKQEEGGGTFLPPLDVSSSSRPSIGSGKGVVGWKAPPKPQPKDQPKQPTVSQLESAKRLSQGLSVASNKPHSVRRNQPGLGESLSVVLDANSSEYLLTAQPQQEAPWPSTKANRLYEEARRNRMRVEAQRNHNGAVLRQQVFFFDPNYENLAALAAQPMAVASGSGGGIGNGPSPTNLALGLDMGVGMNDSVYGGGAGGVGGQAVLSGRRPGASKSPAYAAAAASQFQPVAGYAYAHPTGGTAGVTPPAMPRQEELLKQLFPSWF